MEAVLGLILALLVWPITYGIGRMLGADGEVVPHKTAMRFANIVFGHYALSSAIAVLGSMGICIVLAFASSVIKMFAAGFGLIDGMGVVPIRAYLYVAGTIILVGQIIAYRFSLIEAKKELKETSPP